MTKGDWRKGVDDDLLKLFDEVEACQFKFIPLVAKLGGIRQKLMDQKAKLIEVAKNGGSSALRKEIEVLAQEIAQDLPEIFNEAKAISAHLNTFLAQ